MRSRPRTPPLSKPEDDKDPMTRSDPTRPSHNLSQRPFPILSQKRDWGSALTLTRLNWPSPGGGSWALDQLLSYPSAAFDREKAIAINLEHIQAIITAQKVLLLNSRDPSVTLFMEELKWGLMFHHHVTKAQVLLIPYLKL
ncbi:hypothetical protein OIU84_017431 [Salix udensis]|uniref:Uncharacterized protein n=1 Tax=Salix udensis TaxID=889485 RepID=A0AAD6L213_9ROSI|nr:hypothetical protein OIU84_017431 [Salix udensis]